MCTCSPCIEFFLYTALIILKIAFERFYIVTLTDSYKLNIPCACDCDVMS